LEQFAEFQNKEFQTSRAALAGIPIPKSWYLQTWEELEQIKPAEGRRLIVKPNPAFFVSSAPFKIFFAKDAEEASVELRKFVSSPAGMIVQEFIEGSDENMWVASGYRSRDGKTTTTLTVVKSKQSGSGAGGVGIIVRTEDSPELKAVTHRLLEALDYRGPYAIEFKYCDAQKEFVFIEANYRTARIHVIGRRAGANVPVLAYSDLAKQPRFLTAISSPISDMWYYDMRSCFETLRKTENFGVTWKMIKHMVKAPFRATEWAVHAWDDPAPSVAALREIGRDFCRRIGQRVRRLVGHK
jgi:predicted ATP-grasp superfamily ATP-dependent carboligase